VSFVDTRNNNNNNNNTNNKTVNSPSPASFWSAVPFCPGPSAGVFGDELLSSPLLSHPHEWKESNNNSLPDEHRRPIQKKLQSGENGGKSE